MSDLSAALASAEAQMLAAHPGEYPSWEWLRLTSGVFGGLYATLDDLQRPIDPPPGFGVVALVAALEAKP